MKKVREPKKKKQFNFERLESLAVPCAWCVAVGAAGGVAVGIILT